MSPPPTDASTCWRPWADANDENQACQAPAASAFCPIGGWRPWPEVHDEDQACKLLVAPRAHRLHRTHLWLEASGLRNMEKHVAR